MVSMNDVANEARSLLANASPGTALDEITATLIELAVNASVTCLDVDGIERLATRALGAGATPAQIHETLVLISGLGVHSLLEGSRRLARVLEARDSPEITAPLDEQRKDLWARFVGDDPYWTRLEAEIPGFLDALVRFSPDAFEAFFSYCAVPWRSKALSPAVKELISMAVDATPSHRYLPGMRLHLLNALKIGAGRTEIVETLAIAARGPMHTGVR